MELHLKPCPHCGSEAKFNTITDDPEGSNYQGNYIACEACSATTQLMFSTGEDCRPILAELWNARHGPMNKAPDSMLKFSGTPTEIGGQIWERMCLPAVGKVSRDLTPIATAQIYGGFTMAAWGAMVADFGHVQAVDFARQMLARFEKEAPTLTEDGTTGAH
jgi:hypothetical protein